MHLLMLNECTPNVCDQIVCYLWPWLGPLADSAVHYVLPVFADVDDVLFSHNGPNADTDSGVSNIANYLP